MRVQQQPFAEYPGMAYSCFEHAGATLCELPHLGLQIRRPTAKVLGLVASLK